MLFKMLEHYLRCWKVNQDGERLFKISERY